MRGNKSELVIFCVVLVRSLGGLLVSASEVLVSDGGFEQRVPHRSIFFYKTIH